MQNHIINVNALFSSTDAKQRLDIISLFLKELNSHERMFAKSWLDGKRIFEEFPDEIIVYIFSYLTNASDIYSCLVTCKKWNRILNENMLWKSICFSKRIFLSSSNALWRRVYKAHYLTERNWKYGKFKVSAIENPFYSSGVSMAFDENSVVSLSHGNPNETIPFKMWNIKTKQCLVRIQNQASPISAVQFNSEYIVTGFKNANVKLWDYKGDCIQTFIGHSGEISCIQLHQHWIASGSEDKTMRIWNSKDANQCIECTGHTDSVCSLYFDKHLLASGSMDSHIRIWKITSGECIQELQGHTGGVLCIHFIPNKQLLCSGSQDTTIRIWNLEQGKCIRKLQGHISAIICIKSDNDKIVSGSADHSIKVWDVRTGYNLYTMKEHHAPVWNLHLSFSKLISSGLNDDLFLWDFTHQGQDDDCDSATD